MTGEVRRPPITSDEDRQADIQADRAYGTPAVERRGRPMPAHQKWRPSRKT